MSNQIKTKLGEIQNRVAEIYKNVRAGKRKIAEAIAYNGITNVHPLDADDQEYDSFEQLAAYIRKLKSTNSMVLEFTIPDDVAGAGTEYLRTIVVPMNFKSAGYCDADKEESADTTQSPLNLVARAIIGGDSTIISSDAALTSSVAVDADNPIYDYVVNWGDGTDPCEFIAGRSFVENSAAIYHTYETPGVYDVAITGVFQHLYGNPRYYSDLTVGYGFLNDGGGRNVRSGWNYAMANHLTSIISWGNTLLTSAKCACCNSINLKTIPMYDTINSFSEVEDCSYIFQGCTNLTEIPFNVYTNKGLFSNCTKVKTFAFAFANCKGMTSSIPPRLFNGCSAVTSLAGCFAYSKFTGKIPQGLTEGMYSLEDVSEMFAECQLACDLPEGALFPESSDINNISRLFYKCDKIAGKITRDLIGGLSKITDMRQAFYGCSSITEIAYDAFYNLSSNNIDCRQAFCGCTGIKSLPEYNPAGGTSFHLFSGMTGSGLRLEKMFDRCTELERIPKTLLANLKVANARGMFGGCTSLCNWGEISQESSSPIANADWEGSESSYTTLSKWFGAFAGTGMTRLAIELGGKAPRKFPDRKVGKIMLANKSTVEIDDYKYEDHGRPIGWVYADVYLDNTNIFSPTSDTSVMRGLQLNGTPNCIQADDETAALEQANGHSILHRLCVGTWSDDKCAWLHNQSAAETVATIKEVNDITVGDGMNTPRYCGLEYDYEIARYVLESGYARIGAIYTTYTTINSLSDVTDPKSWLVYLVPDSNDDRHYVAYRYMNDTFVTCVEYDVYLNTVTTSEKDNVPLAVRRFPALSFCHSYKPDGTNTGQCHMQDAADAWDMWVLREWMQTACDKIIQGGGADFTDGNCYAYRTEDSYWLAPQSSSTGAWVCLTNSSRLHHWCGKWTECYVRPSISVDEVISAVASEDEQGES